MTDEQIKRCDSLWSELLTAGRARWMRGMVTASGRIVGRTDPLCVYTDVGVVRVSPADVRIDWSHPANTGCLVAMLREAVGHSAVCVWRSTMTREWGVHNTDRPAFCATEAEALLRAIGKAQP